VQTPGRAKPLKASAFGGRTSVLANARI
jgi:hypothetical protein